MRRINKSTILSEPILHISTAFLGIIIIVTTTYLSDCICDEYERLVAIVSDIGIGLLPAGLVGIFLSAIQKSDKINTRNTQRASLLLGTDPCLHNYINNLCKYCNRQFSAINLSVEEICTALITKLENHHSEVDEIPQYLTDSAKALSDLLNVFLTSQSTFLVSEVFSSEEIAQVEFFSESILKSNNTSAINLAISISTTVKFLKFIPEFNDYLKYKFNGYNIGKSRN